MIWSMPQTHPGCWFPDASLGGLSRKFFPMVHKIHLQNVVKWQIINFSYKLACQTWTYLVTIKYHGTQDLIYTSSSYQRTNTTVSSIDLRTLIRFWLMLVKGTWLSGWEFRQTIRASKWVLRKIHNFPDDCLCKYMEFWYLFQNKSNWITIIQFNFSTPDLLSYVKLINGIPLKLIL